MKSRILSIFFIVFLVGCTVTQPSSTIRYSNPELVQFNILQLNDVYEITPINGGREAGLARVATLKHQLESNKAIPLITVIAGDFFSPSALGTAKVDGKRLAGKQMVSSLNALGLNYATFGNHEFDLSEDEFYQRMEEGNYEWVSSNVLDKTGSSFPKTKTHIIFDVVVSENKKVRVGLFGLTLDSNPKEYVQYRDYMEAAKTMVSNLRPKVDFLIALTHLDITQDIKLAQDFPEIDLIMGGHEHENILVKRGETLVPIAKADANARTVYIHTVTHNTTSGESTVKSELVPIDESFAEDAMLKTVIDGWVETAFAGFREAGFEPTSKVTTSTEPLDGLEASVRNHPTTLTQRIAAGMLHNTEGADASIFNGGSIRIDDVLPAGEITEYDVIRMLPFGGEVLLVEMQGSLLQEVLEAGLKNKGKGGYLQYANIARNGTLWSIGGEAIQANKSYSIAISDFLMLGLEQNLEFLKKDHPSVNVIGPFGDVRKMLINELKSVYQ